MLRLFGFIFLIAALVFGAFGITAWYNQDTMIIEGNYHVVFGVAAGICLFASIVLLRRIRLADPNPLVKKTPEEPVQGPDQPATEGASPSNKAA